MFDSKTTPAHGPLSSGPVDVLSASGISAWTQMLAAGLAGPSGLDDPARVEGIRALEELACVVSAAQAHLAREFDDSQRSEQATVGMPAARQGQGVADQVALARRESPHRGRRHLGLARIVSAELPCTWQAWRHGHITEWKATIIARETACLTRDDRLIVDQAVAADPSTVAAMGDRELAGACLAHVARLDAAALVARRRRAESERRVSLRPAPDTMTYLTALLPVKDGVAVLATLGRAADQARAAGDPRSRGQVMADTLVAHVCAPTTPHHTSTGDGPNTHQGRPNTHQGRPNTHQGRPNTRQGEAASPAVSLGLVMSDTALFGDSDEPAHLDGFGPIPAELAREIVAGACDRDEKVWLRRLYTSPTTGELLTMDTRSRCFRGSLARFIRLRDQVCRTPWCDAPIRHLDHTTPHTRGGPTHADNAQGLCEACNHTKTAPHWHATPTPDGTIETTTPTGHTHTTRPPPLATIRITDLPALRIDYTLTG